MANVPASSVGTRLVRICLVDDHALFRQGIRTLLERHGNMVVVGEAGDGLVGEALVDRSQPDVVLMDVTMPTCDGITALRRILRKHPDLPVVMLTICDDDADLFAALRAGARGYLLKNLAPEALYEMVESVLRGEAPMSPKVSARLLEKLKNPEHQKAVGLYGSERNGLEELTDRECEVLIHVARGYSNGQIAELLSITSGTVKNHLHNILDKLHLRNRAQAAAYAVSKGLVSLS